MPAIQEAGIVRIEEGSWQHIERLKGGDWGGGLEELGSPAGVPWIPRRRSVVG